MRNLKNMFLCLFLIFSFNSCSKDEIIKDTGIPTILKGHVSDNIRGVNINGYKIVLVKSWSSCSNWVCGITSEEIATAYTDNNGDYTISFNYKLEAGGSYGLEEQYYGFPYYPEYLASSGIKSGQTNIININAWKPITLKLNIEVLNNINGPLMVRNEIGDSNSSFLNTENIYEKNIVKTYNLSSRPDSDIKIIFWYYTGTNPVRILHQKSFDYHTTLDEINALNYTIDCSTF